MGVDFKIGNAHIDWNTSLEYAYDWEPGKNWTFGVRVRVKDEKFPDAPALPGDAPWSIHQNEKSMSYGGFSEFVEATGLEDFEKYVFQNHPGCVPLTDWCKEQIDNAIERYKIANPNAVPGYVVSDTGFFAVTVGDKSGLQPVNTNSNKWVANANQNYDAHLARLEWFRWWITWALENCEYPAIEN